MTSCGLYAIIFYCHEVIIFIYDFLKDKFYMQRYRSGHNGTDSKSVVPSGTVGSNPTRSAITLYIRIYLALFLLMGYLGA